MSVDQKLKTLSEAGYPELLIQQQWPPETAGHRMTAKVPIVHPDQTIGDAQTLVFHYIKVFRSVDYIYVVDRHGKLYGVLTIKELYGNPKDVHVGNICKRENLATVHPDTHQERVVYVALKHNIKAVPVTDESKTFLGAVLNDTILSILYKEAHEDLLRLAGVHPHAAHLSTEDTPVLVSLRHRIPWLFLGMLGGLFSASVIGLFETTLEENLILASFIPLIVYMSSAVGMQMQACVIRDLAMNRAFSFRKYLVRQMAVTFGIAVFFSFALSGILGMLHGNATLGVVIGASMFFAIFSSVGTGLVIPYVFSRVRLDPADVSGPVATIIQDLLSVTIYLGTAAVFL